MAFEDDESRAEPLPGQAIEQLHGVGAVAQEAVVDDEEEGIVAAPGANVGDDGVDASRAVGAPEELGRRAELAFEAAAPRGLQRVDHAAHARRAAPQPVEPLDQREVGTEVGDRGGRAVGIVDGGAVAPVRDAGERMGVLASSEAVEEFGERLVTLASHDEIAEAGHRLREEAGLRAAGDEGRFRPRRAEPRRALPDLVERRREHGEAGGVAVGQLLEGHVADALQKDARIVAPPFQERREERRAVLGEHGVHLEGADFRVELDEVNASDRGRHGSSSGKETAIRPGSRPAAQD